MSCNSLRNEKKYTIGFSQCTMVNKWRQTMLEGMQRELSFHPEINFIFKDANGSTALQVQQIDELINQKIDLLIVSPNVAAPITPVVERAYSKGIKVIIVDRRTVSENYTAYVGANNYQVGAIAGAYANSILKGKGNVLEVSDIPGSSADIDRHNGFTDLIKKHDSIHYISRIYEAGDNYPSDEKTTAFLQSTPDIQLIFAQNDRLAFAAYKACKKTGIDKKIKIIGIDGLSGEGGGVDLVENGIIKATVFYPTGGEEAIRTALNILEGKTYQKQNNLATTIIDSANVRIMKLQNNKMVAQQNDIDRRQKIIEQQKVISQNQSTIIYAISISLALALIFGFVLFYYLRENKKIAARLALQHKEILNQRNQLIELGKKAEAASEAKINFFTNISHEFRTPLTLILAPLGEMKNSTRLDAVSKQHLELMQKNSIRLLKLVNELIDFRKIESGKMKLRASENDFVQFTDEIISAFKSIAKKRNIDLRLITKERSLIACFDVSMMDKVIFNLLSNAFKFTADNGFIYVSIEKNDVDKTLTLKVEDNGIGMSPEFAAHAFELFYQENVSDKLGSGLGLSLSKELIQLHRGSISVQSRQGKGTTFTIILPLGADHLKKHEIATEDAAEKNMHDNERIFLTQLSETEMQADDDKHHKSDNTLLIIEDNADLRNYLVQKLGNTYPVLEADNGVAGIQQAFDNVPDLVMSDVILPGKNGFDVTNILKSDIRTSHIPIILLTAKTAVQEQIEGMKNKADAYITKPFNLQFLEETIKSVLKNREVLREHYTSELPIELKSQAPKKLDRKFINDFTSIVEQNISNDAFNVDEICKAIGISRIQLYRKVKALLDCNVNDYILAVRLQKAKYLLNERDLSISEIADKVGFSSAAYFSTVFKNKFLVTPKEFREKGNVKK
ncbi:MAG TPA: substrate-binding domain-containing protein [Parafilimonas sp.]|nr:substrate-binding domain-containing protein [Parafilimonas sp.]